MESDIWAMPPCRVMNTDFFPLRCMFLSRLYVACIEWRKSVVCSGGLFLLFDDGVWRSASISCREWFCLFVYLWKVWAREVDLSSRSHRLGNRLSRSPFWQTLGWNTFSRLQNTINYQRTLESLANYILCGHIVSLSGGEGQQSERLWATGFCKYSLPNIN